MTNREWLESLSDEELAEYIVSLDMWKDCYYLSLDGTCEEEKEVSIEKSGKWLKAEYGDLSDFECPLRTETEIADKAKEK